MARAQSTGMKNNGLISVEIRKTKKKSVYRHLRSIYRTDGGIFGGDCYQKSLSSVRVRRGSASSMFGYAKKHFLVSHRAVKIKRCASEGIYCCEVLDESAATEVDDLGQQLLVNVLWHVRYCFVKSGPCERWLTTGSMTRMRVANNHPGGTAQWETF